MVRISDIFKRPNLPVSREVSEKKPKDEPVEEKACAESKPEVLKPKSADIPLPKPAGDKDQAKVEETVSVGIVKSASEASSDKDDSLELYLSGIHLAKEMFACANEPKLLNLSRIQKWLEEMNNRLVKLDTELLRLFYEYSADNYLYINSVNTAIMCAEVGLGLGYDKFKLMELSLAGFLHDIGMIRIKEITNQARKLTEEEYRQVKKHSEFALEILTNIKNISELVIRAIGEEHERLNGSGYPKGLKGDQISEFARIIAVVDVYEALTHNRSYHKKVSPHDAVKDLIVNNPFLDTDIVRILVNRVGVYPISSLVELNSNEIGKITMNNPGFPLRPVLRVIFDPKKNRLKNPHYVDLARQFNLFIKKDVTGEGLVEEAE